MTKLRIMNKRAYDLFKNETICGDDGYYVWWPEKLGAFSSNVLRDMADILDDMNKNWDEKVQKDVGECRRQEP